MLSGQILCFLFLWGEFIFSVSIVVLNRAALEIFTLCILHSVLQPVAKTHISKCIAIDFPLSLFFLGVGVFFIVHVKLKYLCAICPSQ